MRLVDAAARGRQRRRQKRTKEEAKEGKGGAAAEQGRQRSARSSRWELPDRLSHRSREIKTSLMGHIDVEMHGPKKRADHKGRIHSLATGVQQLNTTTN